MERFIRQKYQHRSLEDGKPKPPSRHASPPPRSPEGSPPPLPPKTGKLFGFPGLRSAASATNLRRPSSNKTSEFRRGSLSPSNTGSGTGPSVAELGTASFASKLTTLRDMGFPDDKRNAVILKGLSGDLDKAIDSLVRQGEGSHPASRSRTPAMTTSNSSGNAVKQEQKQSTNPFDQLDAMPQSQPTGKSYNPFDMPVTQSASQPQPLETSFQNLQVSQPLFPHSTGGYPPQHSLSQPLPQQSATPPVTSSFTQGNFVSSPQPFDGSYNPFFQPAQQQYSPSPMQGLNGGQNNPFFNRISPQSTSMQPQSQIPSSTSLPGIAAPNMPQHANTMPALSSTSPFGQPSPFQLQPQQHWPPSQFQNSSNPFQLMTTPSNPQGAGFQQSKFQPTHQSAGYETRPQQPGLQSPPQNGAYDTHFQQLGLQPTPQQLAPQPTGRMDKGSILSLYNFAPPPPTISEQPQSQYQTGPAPGLNPSSTIGSTQLQSAPAQQNTQAPPTGSRNPFFTSPPGAQDRHLAQPMGIGASKPFQRSHMSQPSVDLHNLQNGRHSPDAFASLSARYG